MNMSSFNALVRTLDVKISIRRTQCSGIPFNVCLCDDLPHLRLQAVSFFLVHGAEGARHTNDHACD